MKVVILGAGELASAVGHRLFRTGFDVVMTEIDEPLAVRRAVSFCAAVWQGRSQVQGVEGRLWKLSDDLPDKLPHVAVVVDPLGQVVSRWRPDVLIDGRILKRQGATSVAQAPLVIGLGPGARCGIEAHVIVETHRGHWLGTIIEQGSALENTGIPGEMQGYSKERVLRTSAEGVICVRCEIGQMVQVGQVVATVGQAQVETKVAGVIRGILRDGTFARANLKLGDVDPRGDVRACYTISDKSRTISGGVLEAILARYKLVK